MELRDRATGFFRALPPGQRVSMIAAVGVFVMMAFLFFRWISTPSYTVLYSGLDDAAVAQVISELETAGVPYQLEAGGSRVMVPRDQLYATRAGLAENGVAGKTTPPGYEILDSQGLSVSDFRQRVDFQRAIEGELAKTLNAFAGIQSATVHLVIPEEELFTEDQEPATASVLVNTTRPLDATEVEAIVFLVSSSVEGLNPDAITVADSSGAVLHAPGDASGSAGLANRQLRQTREFEQAMASDITALLQRATGSPASVVVRAVLNFDETQSQTETYAPDSQVALSETSTEEQYEGTSGLDPVGSVGVDGGPLPDSENNRNYQRNEVSRQFGVDKTTSQTIVAPGKVERLSVAIVMDDGSLTQATVPDAIEVEQLVSAAVGLEAGRGDEIAVTRVAFPAQEEVEEAPTGPTLLDQAPQFAGLLVLLIAAIGLFLMTRRRGQAVVTSVAAAKPVAGALPGSHGDADAVAAAARREADQRESAASKSLQLQTEITQLVQRQPDEIATLLRGWLADRRSM